MADVFTTAKRKEIMARIRSTNTTPEQRVRKILRQCGIPFKTYCATLPGRPDIVIRNSRLALFVHGCFWHQHNGCSRNFTPKSNKGYWVSKLARNVQRFSEVKCQTKNNNRLRKLILRYMSGSTTGVINAI